jgi:hypothetical protein
MTLSSPAGASTTSSATSIVSLSSAILLASSLKKSSATVFKENLCALSVLFASFVVSKQRVGSLPVKGATYYLNPIGDQTVLYCTGKTGKCRVCAKSTFLSFSLIPFHPPLVEDDTLRYGTLKITRT